MSASLHRPVRVRSTWVSYAQIGAYGAFVYAFGASQVLVRDEQGTSRTVAALHGSAWALGLVIMALFNASVAARIGRGRALRLGSVVMMAGILGYTSGLPTWVTLLSTVVAALGGALMIAGVSAFLSTQQGAAAPTALSEANAAGAFAGLLGAFLVGAGVTLTLGWRPALWTLVAYLVLLELWRGRRVADYNTGETLGVSGRVRDMPRLFWWACVLMLPAAGVEYCLALWSADLLRERGDLGSGAATTALATVVAGLTLGRLVGGWLAERFSAEKLLAAAFALAAAAFMIVWVSTNPAVMIGFLFVTGFGVALHWPLAIGRAIRAAPELADRAAGIGTVAAGLAIMVAPFGLGALADSVGLHAAFLIVPALSVLGAFLVLYRPVPLESRDPVV